MDSCAVDDLGYSLLKDLKLEIERKNPTFSLCFWVYLLNSTPFSCTVLRQMNLATTDSAPLLVLNEEKKLILFPLHFLLKESPNPSDSTLMEVPCASSEVEFPMEKWVHVGCEVSTSFIRLHIDGKIVGEKSLDALPVKESDLCSLIYSTMDGDSEGFQGYVHDAKVLPLFSSIKNHHVEDPPLQLSIDNSSASEIEEDSDGVWSIVGGKASCRRNFSLDVVLLDAFGESVHREMEVVASLIYADDMASVEKPDDGEAPLLISYDGLEFSSYVRPSKLLQGRAVFKLKISQLSSKCDNRLFRIKFCIAKFETYPFLEALSPPIRCISRGRNTRISTITWKKLPSGVHLVNGSSCPGNDFWYSELQQNAVCEARPSPSSKRVKLGPDSASPVVKVDYSHEQPDEECNSHVWANSKVQSAFEKSTECKRENVVEAENSASDSESIGARNSFMKNMSCTREIISDLTIFKYCLGSLSERTFMLKEATSFTSDQEMEDLAEHVSLYSGCFRHRHQILIAKRLLEEGEGAWNLISQNSHHVQWENAVFEIEEQFMKISCCSIRSLTQQDLNLLRRISGCHEYMTRENFDKMWRWLYPVAFTISRDGINGLWASTSPKWVEGFITKEEVEYALQNPMGIQEPGTFMLRFPTSRSWPHPDAGSLVVTYVSRDYTLRHRVLSLDYSSGKLKHKKPLQELLLAEPELSRLGSMQDINV
ncbi:hypothetical protein Nepgr_026086 [Nepenthes gracilis]|uniref:SH2 domain-containing protein n=1 Tax=Nepenthes gracilis TaxID=150966 RepID=A0AAD3T670_NEPGR|nr:hypothetical protein Nepgr_026086 [Nepenthes gracilis]